MVLYLLSGDWAEIAPGVRIRGYDMPNEEDCDPLAQPVVEVTTEPPAEETNV